MARTSNVAELDTAVSTDAPVDSAPVTETPAAPVAPAPDSVFLVAHKRGSTTYNTFASSVTELRDGSRLLDTENGAKLVKPAQFISATRYARTDG